MNATTSLAARHCAPCEGGTTPMTRSEAEAQLAAASGWKLIDGEPLKIVRALKFKDFVKAMMFVNAVGWLAEAEGHHPDIHISWNRVRLELYTHSIGGLSENDFIMAAKIDQIKEAGTGEAGS
jgi:4a-hydroxytetrahydrobiopterin dehydratase